MSLLAAVVTDIVDRNRADIPKDSSRGPFWPSRHGQVHVTDRKIKLMLEMLVADDADDQVLEETKILVGDLIGAAESWDRRRTKRRLPSPKAANKKAKKK